MLDKQKLMKSLGPAALFVLLSHPSVYGLTSKFLPGLWDTESQCPTMMGVLVHAVVFGLIQYLTLKGPNRMRFAVTGAIIFVALANSFSYMLVQRILGRVGLQIASPTGCPTMTGTLVHGGVYAAILYGLMSRK